MKVCLVNSFYPPWIGGAERYVSSLARELVKMGDDVTVYCSERPLEAGEDFEDGVRVRRMRTPMMLYGTPLVSFPQEFFSERYDVIHANFPSPLLAAASAFSGALKRSPAVLTWHNDLPPVTSGAGLLVALHEIVSPLYLDRFQSIIATTYVYASRSNTLRKYSDRVVVISNGVDTRLFRPDIKSDQVKAKHNLGGKKIVLFVGALTQWHNYKGLDVLLKSFPAVKSRIPDVKLLVVGDGPMRTTYEELAKESNLQDSAVFVGRVDDSSLPLYYAACDLVVLPSKDSSEGFGLVLLEAMASARAVIGSRVGGAIEVIEDGKNGMLVSPNDPMGLSRQIISLLENDELRAEIGANGRKFAELHDWNRVASEVERIYEELE